ncbi:MAG: tetraacyldisaccharide 4'-kinase, partial [Gammaproteobacteria bacterium]
MSLITAIRRFLYTHGWLKITYLDIPVIVVGNITLGGTGKTPLIIYLAQLLQQHGYQPGIVSRGYGGKNKNYPCSVTPDSDPILMGDEPVLMATKAGVPVIVDPDRVSAARFLQKNYPHCNIILSDDGLQHYALGR